MKIVENYDNKCLIDNVITQALFPNAEIIYVGTRDVLDGAAERRLKDYFKVRKANTIPSFLYLIDKTVPSLLKTLEPIIREKDMFFNARGGSEEMMVAIGILSERYQISIFQVDQLWSTYSICKW